MSNHILIYGYGREGQSTEAFLHQHHFPEVIDIYDTKTHPMTPEWDIYDQIWLSPGISPNQIPVEHQAKITSQANYFFSNLTETERQKVIAITGSKGKTTTTATLTHCLQKLGLRADCAGNIGLPLLDVLPRLQNDKLDYLVLEISSFQAEFIDRSPHTVIFLNLFGDHLDRHGDTTNYFAAKANLWGTQKPGDHLIVPKNITKTLDPQYQIPTRATLAKPLPKKFLESQSIFQADHFRENLGTIALALEALGIKFTDDQLKQALSSAPLTPHRLELVTEINGVKFYDDAIAVNPTATMAAVRFFGKKLGVLILGGKSSGDDPTDLIRLIEEIAPNTKIMVTESELGEELKTIETKLDMVFVKNLEELFTAHRLLLTSGDQHKTVLLSPAAKSYDQYDNFEQKGAHFKELTKTLG